VNHILGMEVVLADGELVWLGGAAPDSPGYDLTGFVVGSEGTLGIVTKVLVRLMRQPEAVRTFLAVFDTVDAASASVSEIIAAGARSKLPAVLSEVIAIGEAHRLPVANLFHAGDGNLHPMILFDVREPGIMPRVIQAGREMLQACVKAGGTISGEHGIGVEKN